MSDTKYWGGYERQKFSESKVGIFNSDTEIQTDLTNRCKQNTTLQISISITIKGFILEQKKIAGNERKSFYF